MYVPKPLRYGYKLTPPLYFPPFGPTRVPQTRNSSAGKTTSSFRYASERSQSAGT
jgi:hypothetical protein